ncbi:MAG: hypothetical protein LV480_04690 [Methylacidiphilales bacterium]|nr:hypothetical protein [Candidatus Methylacidiphilales bacterium]
MKRFFAKAGRFFWSWGFLKFVLWTVTLIVLLYVEEDWRGARAWAVTKAEWEAKGISFDPQTYFPPPVPDDQNLAAIPLFKLEPPDPKQPAVLEPLALQKAMRSNEAEANLPSTGDWQRGELPDMAKIQTEVAQIYAETFKNRPLPADTLVQFDALYPFLAELRAAAATRPLCRFNEDYAIYPPSDRPLELLTAQIRLSQILRFHAILAVNQHQPDLALEDIKINYKLLSGEGRAPTFVGSLIAIGMNAICSSAIYDGLAMHTWNDAQLAEIDRMLESINFLADYQFAMRSEVAESIVDIDYFKKERPDISGWLVAIDNDPAAQHSVALQLSVRLARVFPGGWWDQNKCQREDLFLNSLPSVDPKTQRVFPGQVNELERQIQRLANRKDAYAPWNFLFTLSADWVKREPITFAEAQVWVDEARIACALERYRLAHGVYPDSLDALAPAYIDALPHDIMNGQPYHYQLRTEGTYLLYSVGWNQIDDGGKIVYQQYNPKAVNYKEGDWVWPTAR